MNLLYMTFDYTMLLVKPLFCLIPPPKKEAWEVESGASTAPERSCITHERSLFTFIKSPETPGCYSIVIQTSTHIRLIGYNSTQPDISLFSSEMDGITVFQCLHCIN